MPSNDRADGEYSLTNPVSAPAGKGTPPHIDRDSETVGQTAGGVVGASTGLAIGAIGGPLGAVIGGLAGALGGWWAGREIADAITTNDDAAFRRHFESTADRLADGSYDRIRPAYVTGHLAGRNPEYAGRSFEDVESDLRCGWNADVAQHCGEWPTMRRYARVAFDRARGAPMPENNER